MDKNSFRETTPSQVESSGRGGVHEIDSFTRMSLGGWDQRILPYPLPLPHLLLSSCMDQTPCGLRYEGMKCMFAFSWIEDYPWCMHAFVLPTFAFSGSAISYSSYPSMGEIMNVLFLLHFGPKRGGEQWMPSASAPWTAPTNCNVITAMSHMSSLVVTFFPSVTLSISPTSSTAQLLRCAARLSIA